MALNRYVLTATVTVPAGTGTADPNGFGLMTYAGAASAWAQGFPATFIVGTTIVLDSAGSLYAAIGAGNLRAYVQGSDDVGHAALSN
jgi:hypothetical protein